MPQAQVLGVVHAVQYSRPLQHIKRSRDYASRIAFEYVVPFLGYVESELHTATSDATVASLIDRRISALVEQRITAELPAVSEMLRQIAGEFVRPSDEVNWQNVGNSCRESLKATVCILIDKTSTKLPEGVQLGNIKRVTELLMATSEGSDSRGTLLKLVGAVWDHANTITHRGTTTRSDAVRLFLWTSLAIFELLDMMLTSNVEQSAGHG